jgi:hypothetical protein
MNLQSLNGYNFSLELSPKYISVKKMEKTY